MTDIKETVKAYKVYLKPPVEPFTVYLKGVHPEFNNTDEIAGHGISLTNKAVNPQLLFISLNGEICLTSNDQLAAEYFKTGTVWQEFGNSFKQNYFEVVPFLFPTADTSTIMDTVFTDTVIEENELKEIVKAVEDTETNNLPNPYFHSATFTDVGYSNQLSELGILTELLGRASGIFTVQDAVAARLVKLINRLPE